MVVGATLTAIQKALKKPLGGMLMKKVKLILFIFIIINSYGHNAHAKADVVYTMVNVTSQNLHGDAHVLEFANGKVYVIDAGNEGITGGEKLVSLLKRRRIFRIDKFFVSHGHRDHYGGLVDILKSSIVIREIYFNLPDKDVCDKEQPWGCDYRHILDLRQFINDKRIKIKSVNPGDLFEPYGDVRLKVLFVQNGTHSIVGKTDINDTSIIMKLTNGNKSLLFTGDLNRKVSDFLIKGSFDLQADILKVPHHGTESTAGNDFFESVNPSIALIPSMTSVWLSERSRRIREHFYNKNTETYVSSMDGDVSIFIWKDIIYISR